MDSSTGFCFSSNALHLLTSLRTISGSRISFSRGRCWRPSSSWGPWLLRLVRGGSLALATRCGFSALRLRRAAALLRCARWLPRCSNEGFWLCRGRFAFGLWRPNDWARQRAGGGLPGVHYAKRWCRRAAYPMFLRRAREHCGASVCNTLASCKICVCGANYVAFVNAESSSIPQYILHALVQPLVWPKMRLFITTGVLTHCAALLAPRNAAPWSCSSTAARRGHGGGGEPADLRPRARVR